MVRLAVQQQYGGFTSARVALAAGHAVGKGENGR